jgi:hypothetical protein
MHWQDHDGGSMLLGHFNLGCAMAQLLLVFFLEGRALRSVVSLSIKPFQPSQIICLIKI